jgi:sulfoxide reductase catalytic subunit YedY
MLIRTGRDGFQHPIASEITPRAVYEDRRRLLKWMATGVAGAALASGRGARRWRSRSRPGKLRRAAAVRSTCPAR